MRREVTGAQCARFGGPRRGSICGACVCTTAFDECGSGTRAKTMNRALVLALPRWSGPAPVAPARGQTAPTDYPHRAVTFLSPFPAGGGTDILTRMLAQELQEKLARPAVVDN